jgi:chromosome segregation ATPase
MMEEEKEMTVEKLKADLATVRAKLLDLYKPLQEAREAHIKNGEQPFGGIYKTFKKLDDKDSQLRAEASEIEDEISYLED